MKIQFLGTAAAEGAPALFCPCKHCTYAREVLGREVRTRAGSILDGKIKLDFGPDSYKHMIDNRIDYTWIRSLLITHSHDDHFCVDDIAYRRPGFAHLTDDVPPLTVYGNAKVGEMLAPHLHRWLQFQEVKPFETIEIEGYQVTPLEAAHCVTHDGSRNFPIIHEGTELFRSEQALFYFIEKDGKSLLYAHDTDTFSPAVMDFLAGKKIDLITLDCTNGYLECDYVGHMGASDNLRLREALLANGAADVHTVFVANHFSHNGLVSHEELEKLLPGFIISYDSLAIDF